MDQRINTAMYPPASLVLLFSSDKWEAFIEDCCRVMMDQDGKYKFVQQIGGAGDAGRDIEARYTDDLLPREWDLYQAKHYASSLGESTLYPELAKTFHHINSSLYPEPNYYYICAPKNTSPRLHDLIAKPDLHKSTFLEAWKNGKMGIKTSLFPFNDNVEKVVQKFDFSRIKEYPVKDLLKIHSRNSVAHEILFGVYSPRADNPIIPDNLSSYEIKYVRELLRIYEEFEGVSLDLDTIFSTTYCDHLQSCRGEFYSAEGLKRFSRDIMPGEFEKLLDMIHLGVKRDISDPRLNTGFQRLDAVITNVSSLKVSDSPLSGRLQPPDLPGTCHHLVNDEKFKWVK